MKNCRFIFVPRQELMSIRCFYSCCCWLKLLDHSGSLYLCHIQCLESVNSLHCKLPWEANWWNQYIFTNLNTAAKLISRQKAKAGFNDHTGVHVISWGSKVHWWKYMHCSCIHGRVQKNKCMGSCLSRSSSSPHSGIPTACKPITDSSFDIK